MALVSSANIDEPDLVIAKFTFEKYLLRLLLKLKVSKSILFFGKKILVFHFDLINNADKFLKKYHEFRTFFEKFW